MISARKRVPMAAAFLNAMGVVSYNVLNDVTLTDVDETQLEQELRTRLEPLRNINWERSAEIWQDNLVVDDRIRTQTPAIRAAAVKLSELLELA